MESVRDQAHGDLACILTNRSEMQSYKVREDRYSFGIRQSSHLLNRTRRNVVMEGRCHRGGIVAQLMEREERLYNQRGISVEPVPVVEPWRMNEALFL